MKDSATYVVAVSGGVDSVVLLHGLVTAGAAGKLVVAHFDHGIRPDSADDRHFVAGLAHIYGLLFEYGEGGLGSTAGEASARDARYRFLRAVAGRYGAAGIMLAHHQDDLLETAILNMRRGTGRKGLSSLRDGVELRRPLLRMTKRDIYDYALRHRLEWREDATNHSDAYRRNRIRHHEVPKLGNEGRSRLLVTLAQATHLNDEIDGIMDTLLDAMADPQTVDRRWFGALPPEVQREFVAAWLRRQGIRAFDRIAVHRLCHAIVTFANGKQADIDGRHVLRIARGYARIGRRDNT